MIKIYFFVLIIFISSCQISGSLGGLVGYQKKLTKSNSVVLEYQENICIKNYKPSTVFVVNGQALKKCLSEYEESLIYIWKPNCSSDSCIPLTSIERIADSLNVKLFIVSEYYDEDKMKIDYNIKTPILGIDCQYYKSSFTQKYLKSFLQDVTQKSDVSIHSFYLFERNVIKFKTNDYQELYKL